MIWIADSSYQDGLPGMSKAELESHGKFIMDVAFPAFFLAYTYIIGKNSCDSSGESSFGYQIVPRLYTSLKIFFKKIFGW